MLPAPTPSDHRPLIVELPLTVPVKRYAPSPPTKDYSALRNDHIKTKWLNTYRQTQLVHASSTSPSPDTETLYTSFCKACLAASSDLPDKVYIQRTNLRTHDDIQIARTALTRAAARNHLPEMRRLFRHLTITREQLRSANLLPEHRRRRK